MEQFHHGHHVRLRSRVHGLYLHADEDGHGVSLRHRRDSTNVVWAVHVYDPYAEEGRVLLQSAAYGRYLAATATFAPAPRSHRIIQRNHYHPGLVEIIWEVHRSGFEDDVELRLRHAGAGAGYLCAANGRYLRWKTNGVSVDGIDNASVMMHWVVEPIPAAAEGSIPRLPRQTGLPLPGSLTWTRLLRSRAIECEEVSADGTRISHGAFVFRGRSVFRLRKKLVRLLGVANLVICFPTRDGRLFPLLVDLLPTSGLLFHIVVVTPGTPGE
ncbi:hypothetical protein CFC21_107475 [Triticum aestivum]|uniref:DUF569 domain-containing protein n=2 Tax=Triticum aestivum TaxID=4565 RepID=A0A9R1MGT6_WHEAT|nr:hypothetical protein CFC21_107475 [Triticum aestivum]